MYLQVFIIGILSGMSPGPDFLIVMKNSLGYGKKIGIASAIGIATALLIHVSYTILGLAYILQDHIYIFKSIQFLGAIYLAYLGYQALSSSFSGKGLKIDQVKNNDKKTFIQGFKNGFICNILNPKAVLFFLSIFSQFIKRDMPGWVNWVYGLEIVLAVGLWFVILSILISNKYFNTYYKKYAKWFDRIFGIVLLYFSIKIFIMVIS